MADDEDDALASKILLARASNKNKVKSWLSASLPTAKNEVGHEEEEEFHDDLSDLKTHDDNAGIGVSRNTEAVDDFSNRQLLSANDALRRKLMSKDAYKVYQQGAKSKLEASKPLPKQARRQVDIDSDEEGKGRPAKSVRPNDHADIQSGGNENNVAAVTSSKKKRPASYLDQLLAERSQKKKSKC